MIKCVNILINHPLRSIKSSRLNNLHRITFLSMCAVSYNNIQNAYVWMWMIGLVSYLCFCFNIYMRNAANINIQMSSRDSRKFNHPILPFGNTVLSFWFLTPVYYDENDFSLFFRPEFCTYSRKNIPLHFIYFKRWNLNRLLIRCLLD